ncbi:DUF6603 domain-containing protein [Streptomyces sp. NPDC008001]|uniref:DUF6603 domain-containing protein n=1 Tax=Streptomyces sp. NPDC008001 TaxID=3364804 RepID=UPI0036E116B9
MAGEAPDVALLHATLRFCSERLKSLDHALASPRALADALGLTLSTPAATGVDGPLQSARDAVAGLAGDVAAGLPCLNDAVTYLATAVRQIDLAARAADPGKGAADVLGLALTGSLSPTGPIGELLGTVTLSPGQLTCADGRLTFLLKTTNRKFSAFLNIAVVSLTTQLLYDEMQGTPSLRVDLKATGAQVKVPVSSLLTAIGVADTLAATDVSVSVNSAHGGLTFGGITAGNAASGRVALPASARGKPARPGLVTIRGMVLAFPESAPGSLDLLLLVEGGLGSAVRLLVDGAGVRIGFASGKSLTVGGRLPDGFGVVIKAGPVEGGGYLQIRPDQGATTGTRYGGVFRLRLGPVDVKAFGLLTDRADGHSFVVVMSVEFAPPIELGLLFTLNGIGGIVGADVSADTEALRAGLQSGATVRLLFPPDPVRAAPALLDALGASFPPRPGGFVAGPMVKLGWGRPVTLVTFELALVLSLPDPKVLLLGRLRMVLPTQRLGLIVLNAEIYGEFCADRALVIASLVDSYVGLSAVSGDIGVLLRFGGDPLLAISAGGFHPRFRPPDELAGLRRLTADLAPPVGFQFRLETYVALTPSTLQFGGRLEAVYGVPSAAVHGHLALDALVRFLPHFGFEADVTAGVSIRAFGLTIAAVELRLRLEGPSPWRAWGTGRVSLPWPLPDVSIDVGPITWGEDAAAPPESVVPRKAVSSALSEPAAWSAPPAPGLRPPVQVRDEPVPSAHADDTAVLVVNPWSLLQATQGVVPLDTDIQRVGGASVPDGEGHVTLGAPSFVTSGGAAAGAVAAYSKAPEKFAPGQYLDLPDEEVLRRPSFEDFPAGVRIDPGGVNAGATTPVQAELAYETSFPHHPGRPRGDARLFTLVHESGLVLSATAAGSSDLRADDRYAVAAAPLPMTGPEHVLVRGTADLATAAGLPDGPLTWTHAAQTVSRALADDPDRAGTLQVVALGAAR